MATNADLSDGEVVERDGEVVEPDLDTRSLRELLFDGAREEAMGVLESDDDVFLSVEARMRSKVQVGAMAKTFLKVYQDEKNAAKNRELQNALESDNMDLNCDEFVLSDYQKSVIKQVQLSFGPKQHDTGSIDHALRYVYKLFNGLTMVCKLTNNPMAGVALYVSVKKVNDIHKTWLKSGTDKEWKLPTVSCNGSSSLLAVIMTLAAQKEEELEKKEEEQRTEACNLETVHANSAAGKVETQFLKKVKPLGFTDNKGPRQHATTLVKYMVHSWCCYPNLSRLEIFDMCVQELIQQKPTKESDLTALVEKKMNGIRIEVLEKKLVGYLAGKTEKQAVDGGSEQLWILEEFYEELEEDLKDYFDMTTSTYKMKFVGSMIPHPLLELQRFLKSPDVPEAFYSKFQDYLKLSPRMDDHFLEWMTKHEEMKKKKLDRVQRQREAAKRKAEKEANSEKKKKQKEQDKLAKARQMEAKRAAYAELVGTKDKEDLHAPDGYKKLDFQDFTQPNDMDYHAPQVIVPTATEGQIPKGYLKVDEEGKPFIKQPGKKWRLRMQKVIFLLSTVTDLVNASSEVPSEMLVDEVEMDDVSCQVWMALWTFIMGKDSPVHSDGFNQLFFKELAIQSSKVFLSDYHQRRIGAVFACVYYHSIGPAAIGGRGNFEDNKKLLGVLEKACTNKNRFVREEIQALRGIVKLVYQVHNYYEGNSGEEFKDCEDFPSYFNFRAADDTFDDVKLRADQY